VQFRLSSRALPYPYWNPLFPTIRGLVFVDPAKLPLNSNPPPVLIESVRIDGELQNTDTLRMVPLQSITVPLERKASKSLTPVSICRSG